MAEFLKIFDKPYNLTPVQIEFLKEDLKLWEEKVDEVYENCTSFEEYSKCYPLRVLNYLNRVYKLYDSYELKELPDYGDHMTIEDFKEYCDCGGFCDYDGYGLYATETQMSNIDINPSDIETGLYRKDFTHVVWFNK